MSTITTIGLFCIYFCAALLGCRCYKSAFVVAIAGLVLGVARIAWHYMTEKRPFDFNRD